MLLDLRRVSKRFGGLQAVANVSLGVEKGSIFGLIGPNGAGKTTLFNLVSGVDVPDEGDIFFDGEDVTKDRAVKVATLGLARTFQNVRLFSELTATENLLVAAENERTAGLASALLRTKKHHDDEARSHERAAELLRVFELEAFADAKATSLPYGSQRRLEIARAMMTKPKLLLLDEPAAGMSTVEADGLVTQMKWLRATFGVTLMLVEHNMRVVMAACEEIHVLDHGTTIAQGTPETIRNDPKVIASYLGKEAET